MAGPKLPDPMLFIQAGIDPKTHLPIKLGGNPETLKEDIKKLLRVEDEQTAINRFEWTGFPGRLTSQEVERFLYYYGQMAFFYLEDLDEYFLMPYALDGTIDFYGRFNSIHPVPLATGNTEDKQVVKAQADYLSKKKLQCIYMEDDIPKFLEKFKNSECCVLLHDYSKQRSQTIIARQILNDPLLSVMSECIPFLRTSLLIGTGIKGMRVNDGDQAHNVEDAAKSMVNSAMTGKPWIPIIGNIEFQELAEGGSVKPEVFLQAYQSLDNLRLQTYGIANNGLYEKKAQMLESESENNQSNVSPVMDDSLQIRQHFCDCANALFGLNITVQVKNNNAEDAKNVMTESEGGEDGGTQHSDDASV